MALGEYRGHIFVFGGATQESQPNALKSWDYDPAADTWKELAPMPSKRTASIAIESGGKFYVIGGSDEAGLSVATNEVYDIATNKWSTGRAMPTARNHPAGGAVAGKLYIIGVILSATCVRCSYSTPSWASPPSARSRITRCGRSVSWAVPSCADNPPASKGNLKNGYDSR